MMKSIRDGFGEALVELGETNKDVVVLTADLADSTRVKAFAEAFPDRFFQVGVAEQALVTVAAGMAIAGKIPFATSYAVFSPGRTWEQIKITGALNNVPIKIVGAHAGFGASMYGATHESLEDIALMRVIPNMVIESPCDYEQAKVITKEITLNGKPSYLRLARQESPEIGLQDVLVENHNPEVVIFGTGPILHEAVLAARQLDSKGIKINVINLHTIKPINEQLIIKHAKISGAVVSVEEHQVMGGLGSAVAQVLAKNFPVPMEFVGVEDSFGESALNPRELWQKFGLTKENIIEKVMKVIIRKNGR